MRMKNNTCAWTALKCASCFYDADDVMVYGCDESNKMVSRDFYVIGTDILVDDDYECPKGNEHVPQRTPFIREQA